MKQVTVYCLHMQPAVIREVLLDIVMFPVWWYSRGLILMMRWCSETLRGYARYLGIGVWMKNIFVPMFGQNDWQSRLISVFMRTVQIFGRTVALGVVAIIVMLIGMVYVAAPMFLGLEAAYHVIGSALYVS